MATKIGGQVQVINFPDAAAGSLADPYHVVVDSLPGGASSVVDVSDRVARVLGEVTFPAAQHVIVDSAPAAGADVTDRSARLLGHVTVDNASLAVTGTFWQATQPVSGTFWQTTQPVSLAAAVDVSDRAGRLLGVVSGGANVFHVDDNAGSITVYGQQSTATATWTSAT